MIELREPLSEEEQLKLFKDRNNLESKEKLILHNLKLVMWVAKQYYRPGENELDDLFQAGVIGLMRAIEGYEVDKGMLSSYAVWWIKQSITRDITDTGKVIRIPAYMAQEVNNLRMIKRELFQELEREPTPKELSIKLDISINKVNEILNIIQDPISLNMVMSGENGEATLESIIEDKEANFENDLISSMFIEEFKNEFKGKLSELQYETIRLYYGLDGTVYTLQEITDKYDCKSKDYVRSQRDEALRTIRRSRYSQEIKKEIEERTSYIRGIDYSQPRSKGGVRSSPVENIVLLREKMLDEFKKRDKEWIYKNL